MYCHMKKRIKKDLTLRWPVRINGQEGNLNTLPGLKLELIDPRLQSTFPPFTTDGNVIVFRLRPEMQTAIGDYKLTLWCNYGSECQSCVDKSKAVTLVHSTEQESNQDTFSSVVVNETIALQGGDIEVDMSLTNHTHRANDVFYGNKSVAEKLDELEIAEGNLSAHISATDQSLANEEIRAKAAERANAASLNNFMQDLNEVMPVSASAQNQLADKNFVNSSVATNTANFVGTFNTLNDLETVPSPTNNDYGFVVSTDQDGNVVYRRYKYSVRDNEWLFEYALNNSSFTAAQWASIQSGITAALVAKLIGLPTNSELMALLSSYLLKSGGTLTGNLNLNISGRSNNVLYASDNRELVRFGDNGIIIGNSHINLRLETDAAGKLTHKVGNNNYEILDTNNVKTINGTGNLTLEDFSNKTNDIASNSSNTTKYPSCKGVVDYVADQTFVVTCGIDPSDIKHINKTLDDIWAAYSAGKKIRVLFSKASGVVFEEDATILIDGTRRCIVHTVVDGVHYIVTIYEENDTTKFSFETKEDNLFIAEYGVTTENDIYSAYDEGKIVIVVYNSIVYYLTNVSNGVTFSGVSNGSAINEITVSGSTWSLLTTSLEKTSDRISSITDDRRESKYPNERAVYDALFVKGVLSQTQTWTVVNPPLPRTYTMSNIVRGNIPKAFVDLVEPYGAVFNQTSGYFEFNGLTDISYEEMRAIYNHGAPRLNGGYFFYSTNIRTNIYCQTYRGDVAGNWLARDSKMEVINFQVSGSTTATKVNNGTYPFYDCIYLKEIIGPITPVSWVYSGSGASPFKLCYNLESLQFKGMVGSTDFGSSTLLTLDAVVYMVQNAANTSAITITLHSIVYQRCVDDTNTYEYEGATYTGIIALATAKDITIASA